VVLSGFCNQLQFVYFVGCIKIFDKSLLRIYLITLELPSASDMSDNRESESDADPMVADSSGSSHDLPGPRARGRARPSPGRMRPPFPPFDPSRPSYPREVTGLGLSSVGSAWPWPQAIAPAVSGAPSSTALSVVGGWPPTCFQPRGYWAPASAG